MAASDNRWDLMKEEQTKIECYPVVCPSCGAEDFYLVEDKTSFFKISSISKDRIEFADEEADVIRNNWLLECQKCSWHGDREDYRRFLNGKRREV